MDSPRRASSGNSQKITAPARNDAREVSWFTSASTDAIAEYGVSGEASVLPHRNAIQRSFGRHDVSGLSAFTDTRATAATEAMGSLGYVRGARTAFRGAPTLHTSAHEAAHYICQGDADSTEEFADSVADAVVAGKSAEALLDARPRSASGRSALVVQHKKSNSAPTTVILSPDDHYKNIPWEKLKRHEVVAFAGLGWNELLWSANRAPLSTYKHWNQLTKAERKHANVLHYSALNWSIPTQTELYAGFSHRQHFAPAVRALFEVMCGHPPGSRRTGMALGTELAIAYPLDTAKRNKVVRQLKIGDMSLGLRQPGQGLRLAPSPMDLQGLAKSEKKAQAASLTAAKSVPLDNLIRLLVGTMSTAHPGIVGYLNDHMLIRSEVVERAARAKLMVGLRMFRSNVNASIKLGTSDANAAYSLASSEQHKQVLGPEAVMKARSAVYRMDKLVKAISMTSNYADPLTGVGTPNALNEHVRAIVMEGGCAASAGNSMRKMSLQLQQGGLRENDEFWKVWGPRTVALLEGTRNAAILTWAIYLAGTPAAGAMIGRAVAAARGLSLRAAVTGQGMIATGTLAAQRIAQRAGTVGRTAVANGAAATRAHLPMIKHAAKSTAKDALMIPWEYAKAGYQVVNTGYKAGKLAVTVASTAYSLFVVGTAGWWALDIYRSDKNAWRELSKFWGSMKNASYTMVDGVYHISGYCTDLERWVVAKSKHNMIELMVFLGKMHGVKPSETTAQWIRAKKDEAIAIAATMKAKGKQDLRVLKFLGRALGGAVGVGVGAAVGPYVPPMAKATDAVVRQALALFIHPSVSKSYSAKVSAGGKRTKAMFKQKLQEYTGIAINQEFKADKTNNPTLANMWASLPESSKKEVLHHWSALAPELSKVGPGMQKKIEASLMDARKQAAVNAGWFLGGGMLTTLVTKSVVVGGVLALYGLEKAKSVGPWVSFALLTMTTSGVVAKMGKGKKQFEAWLAWAGRSMPLKKHHNAKFKASIAQWQTSMIAIADQYDMHHLWPLLEPKMTEWFNKMRQGVEVAAARAEAAAARVEKMKRQMKRQVNAKRSELEVRGKDAVQQLAWKTARRTARRIIRNRLESYLKAKYPKAYAAARTGYVGYQVGRQVPKAPSHINKAMELYRRGRNLEMRGRVLIAQGKREGERLMREGLRLKKLAMKLKKDHDNFIAVVKARAKQGLVTNPAKTSP